MEPRLSSSQKWTALPEEFCQQIQSIFTKSFQAQMDPDSSFVAEGRIYKEELLIRIGYKEPGRLKQANWELSIQYDANKDNVVKLIYLGVDVAATLVEEYFKAEKDASDFPKVWQAFEVEGRDIYLQYSAINTDLESQADELLKENDDSLVQGEDDQEQQQEKENLKKMLGLDEDTGDDNSSQ